MTRIPLIVFGLGKVGRTFVRQLVRNGATLSRRLRLQLVVVGLSQRDYMLLDPSGLGTSRLMAIVEGLESGQSLLHHEGGQIKPDNRSLLDALLPMLDEPPVVIDATSTEGMETDLLYALDRDCLLALANARTLVGPWAVRRRFFEDPRVRFEATVGAGLPVTRTLRDLLETGDRASVIEGSLSGTVGYICSTPARCAVFRGAGSGSGTGLH